MGLVKGQSLRAFEAAQHTFSSAYGERTFQKFQAFSAGSASLGQVLLSVSREQTFLLQSSKNRAILKGTVGGLQTIPLFKTAIMESRRRAFSRQRWLREWRIAAGCIAEGPW